MAAGVQDMTGSRIVARPRYNTRPIMSVTVVTATADASAGSM